MWWLLRAGARKTDDDVNKKTILKVKPAAKSPKAKSPPAKTAAKVVAKAKAPGPTKAVPLKKIKPEAKKIESKKPEPKKPGLKSEKPEVKVALKTAIKPQPKEQPEPVKAVAKPALPGDGKGKPPAKLDLKALAAKKNGSAAPEGAQAPGDPDKGDQDAPLLDMSDAAVRKMVTKAKQRGYVTYDELNRVLPSDKVSSEQIEDTMSMLSE